MKFKAQFLFFLTLFFFLGCSDDQEIVPTENGEALSVEIDTNNNDNYEAQTQNSSTAIPGEYIITFKEDTESRSLMSRYELSDTEMRQLETSFTQKSKSILAENSVREDKLEKVYFGAINGFKLQNATQEDLDLLKLDRRIVSIEPNYLLQADLPKPVVQGGISKEELSKMSAGLVLDADLNRMPEIPVQNRELSNGELIPWGANWVGIRNGRPITAKVYIIDTGIAPHSDLNIFTGQSRSFVDGEGWQDLNGHGTHVAGIVGAKRNGDGIIGVCFNIRMVAVKILDQEGSGSIDNMISGFNYVFNRANSQDVFNFSVGFNDRFTSDAIDNAMTNLTTKIVGAIAAGNSNDNTQFYSPQRVNESRSWMVGALNNNIQTVNFSNFGNSIDRWAPGQNIISTWLNGDYQILSGTSMASPHIAAILAFRGNNTVRRRGDVSKGGFTDPVARM